MHTTLNLKKTLSIIHDKLATYSKLQEQSPIINGKLKSAIITTSFPWSKPFGRPFLPHDELGPLAPAPLQI